MATPRAPTTCSSDSTYTLRRSLRFNEIDEQFPTLDVGVDDAIASYEVGDGVVSRASN